MHLSPKEKKRSRKLKGQFSWTEKSIFRFRKSNTIHLKIFQFAFTAKRTSDQYYTETNRSLLCAAGAYFPRFHDLVASMISHAWF